MKDHIKLYDTVIERKIKKIKSKIKRGNFSSRKIRTTIENFLALFSSLGIWKYFRNFDFFVGVLDIT